MKDNKNIFTISLINKWYIIISLILILMQYLKIINIHPIWLISPIWIPSVFALSLFAVIYILKLIVFIIDFKK